MQSSTAHELPFDVEQLLSDSAREILRHENPQRFLRWFRDRLPQYVTDHRLLMREPGALHALATILGPAIWNATPLPGHGFHPQPLPSPGRNDPCPCGSGKKYKECCARGMTIPPLAQTAMWPFVLKRLSANALQQAIAAHKVPVEALAELAQNYLDQGSPKKAQRLLEPLFTDLPRAQDDAHAAALYVLCDVYNELGQENRKRELLQRLVVTLPASPLRSSAKQRLATVYLDADESAKAWELFHSVQQESPNDPDVGMLEVQLLLGERRTEQARERAQFWARRLQRQGIPRDDPMLNFLQAIAKDPLATMARIGFAVADGAGDALPAWLERVRGRPVPHYRAVEEPPTISSDTPGDELRERLRTMGLSQPEIERMEREIEEMWANLPDMPDEETASDVPTLFLAPPDQIAALEQRWHEVFPLGKPFSVQETPFGTEDPWDPDSEDEWMRFLETHPAAFDSLDILDDLATALVLHSQAGTAWIDKVLVEPVLVRARSIIEQALEGRTDPKLAWSFAENRPALRSLARLALLYQAQGRPPEATALMERILALNPNDNHGFRSLVMNDRLRQGDDAQALALAERYPNDANPDIAYGQVLALYRLGRTDEAADALCRAKKSLPKVVRHLTADQVREPRIDAMGVRAGGDGEAWLYRQQMRAVWQATPGALPWLEDNAKRCKRKRA